MEALIQDQAITNGTPLNECFCQIHYHFSLKVSEDWNSDGQSKAVGLLTAENKSTGDVTETVPETWVLKVILLFSLYRFLHF